MILHIFNPEHDLALASNLANFTAPHAGRQLRSDLGYLPALWAADGDCVLVESVEQARRAYGRLRARVGGDPCQFVDKHQLSRLDITEVRPWGWDLALRSFLLRYGVEAVPDEEAVATIRDLSHRRQAVRLLRELQMPGTVGYSVCADQMAEVHEFLRRHGRIVVKAPWSSSGRGIRFIDGSLNDYHEGWIRHVVEQQQCVVLEPYFNKVKDFGMEFESDAEGQVHYCGLSLFETKHGAYTGNLIATEEVKLEMISRYVSVELLTDVKERLIALLTDLCRARYAGPLGVDMMIVASPSHDGFLLHPCVEVNLRRTMGHAALAVTPLADGFPRVMSIVLTDKYRIQIRKQ